jgi:hypothetical protein
MKTWFEFESVSDSSDVWASPTVLLEVNPRPATIRTKTMRIIYDFFIGVPPSVVI